ncbi:hypothetical protein L3X38_016735 [Prunus dulcis]|uniref:Uncharacterized protein n=1 Tax=Prunus dulcis TaxID=3755 RepID=A0AAD4Z9G3_PRUDU|nr:hypothetical protein L3X38_016735 [Prunus dulcis]
MVALVAVQTLRKSPRLPITPQKIALIAVNAPQESPTQSSRFNSQMQTVRRHFASHVSLNGWRCGLHAGYRRRSVSARPVQKTKRLHAPGAGNEASLPSPQKHQRPIGSLGNLPQTNLPNGRASANPQGRTKFPSEEPSEENLGDYCLYRILTTNDHLTRGRDRPLDVAGPSAGPLPNLAHLDTFAMGHVSRSQSAPTVPHRKYEHDARLPRPI